MIVLLDNKDSFTYNLAAALTLAGGDVHVIRVDKTSMEQLRQLPVRGLVISPGPGSPEDASLSVEAVRAFGGSVPIFGVCLGMQCIAVAHGAAVVRTTELVHGEATPVHHDSEGIFRGVRSPVPCVRYHSLGVDPETVDGTGLTITAQTRSGVPMALRHTEHDVTGVQFHPESIGTEAGNRMIRTWVHDRGLQNEKA
jgi:anthranilate synthase/aminodeoxychorismate synthase-like glutamine amidotransferase